MAVLLGYTREPQKYVRAWSADSLTRLAVEDAALTPAVEALIEDFERSGSPALVSRARQIRKRQHASSAPAGLAAASMG